MENSKKSKNHVREQLELKGIRTIKGFAGEIIICENENYFGSTLREFRKNRNMTQIDAADALGVTQAQWSAYEVGKTRPTLETILLMAAVLGVEPLTLIKESLNKSAYFNKNHKDENETQETHSLMIASY